MEGEIRFVDIKLKAAFEELKKSDRELYKQTEHALKNISKDVFCSRNVKKKLIPRTLIQKYGINNLWIYNLPQGWRLIYSVINPSKV
jgi:hypothetical protein